jgi:hypothetical protein
LDALGEEAVLGDEQVEAFPAEGQEVEIEQRGDGADARTGVRPPGDRPAGRKKSWFDPSVDNRSGGHISPPAGPKLGAGSLSQRLLLS